MWLERRSNVWFFECSIQGSTLTLLDFLLVCSIWLDPEHAESAGHVWRKFHVRRHLFRREEIEQNVWYRNYISLDISKVLLKMYSKCFLVDFSCPARDPWFAGQNGQRSSKTFCVLLDYFYNLEEVSNWYIMCIPSLASSLRVRTMPKIEENT